MLSQSSFIPLLKYVTRFSGSIIQRRYLMRPQRKTSCCSLRLVRMNVIQELTKTHQLAFSPHKVEKEDMIPNILQ